MATLSPEFRIILDKINYSGASVGSEWIFDFDFKISSGGQSFDLKQAISRKVSFNKNQSDINRTLVRADFDPATKSVAISGMLKASDQDTLAMQYADKWRMNCITQITSSGFLAASETDAQKAAAPVLSRAIQTVKDWKKKNCK